MLNEVSPGFLVGAAGCSNALRISGAFFASCSARLPGLTDRVPPYQPWMSSAEFSRKLAFGNVSHPELIRPLGKLDFRPEFLNAISDLYTSSAYINAFDELDSHQVFVTIENDRFESVEFFKAALLLVNRWPDWLKTLFENIVQSIIPICRKADLRETGNAVSSRHALGIIFASVDPNDDYPDLALNIDFAHEVGHQLLFMVQHAGNLFLEDAMVYSPVRKTMRPAIRSLHAAVAMGNMIECTKALLSFEHDVSKQKYLNKLLNDFQKGLRLGILGLSTVKKTAVCEAVLDDLRHINEA